MAERAINFNAGPAALPLDVLKTAQAEFLDYKNTGMSVLEISHRSAEYDEINEATPALVREVLGLGDDYHVIFMGGGASTQFATIPMNFLTDGKTAYYADTGAWSNKAIKEAKMIGNTLVVASSKDDNYTLIPDIDLSKVPSDAAYLHVTSNNTIHGTQYHKFPDVKGVPFICDMSSDVASRRLNFKAFDLIYAGAQKNIGPAGVTMVIIKDSLLRTCNSAIPTMLNYKTHADKKSVYNTPPVFAVYLIRLVLEWVKKQGGLKAIEKVNNAKQERVYQMMDLHPDFYRGTARHQDRSWMNLTMRLPNEELEKKFVSEAKTQGMVGLKGHRSVGGIRVSLYNAVPLEGVEKLVAFMEAFRKAN